MREKIARWVAVSVVLILTGLSLFFAWIHNPPVQVAATIAPAEPAPEAVMEAIVAPPVTQDATVELGRMVYMDQGCATCHSIEGAGNPRYPLDGVGLRWEAAGIREWITGTDFAADILPEGIVRRKARYLELPEESLGALVQYLSTLTTDPE